MVTLDGLDDHRQQERCDLANLSLDPRLYLEINGSKAEMGWTKINSLPLLRAK